MFLLPQLLVAQTTSSEPKKASDKVITLDPYSVVSKKDYGYRATNSTTATRLDAAEIKPTM